MGVTTFEESEQYNLRSNRHIIIWFNDIDKF